MFEQKKQYFSEKNIAVILLLLLSAIYISLVWNNNVWMDEAFTASLIHTDFAGVISRSMADTLPPLYNIILKLMTDIFGYSIPVMKITSVIPMILTLVLGATVVRKRFGIKCAALFMLSVAVMPIMLYYGVEIRMYSLGFFFATGSGIYAYEIAAEPSRKNWTLFTLLSVLAGYSHHFAFVTAAFSYLYLLLFFIFVERERLASWFKCLGATFLLYLPCLIVTISQIKRVNGYFSMPDVDMAFFIHCALYPYITGFFPATVLCGLVMAASVVIFAYWLISGKDRGADKVFGAYCFVVYYGVLIFGTIVSKVMSGNIFTDRYLFFATGLLWLSAAIILSQEKKIFCVTVVATLLIGVVTYSGMYKNEYGNSADEEIGFLRANINEGDVLYTIGGHEELQNCIPFYTYVDDDTCELEFVYPLEEALRVSKERKTTLWIAVMEGSGPSEDDEEILQREGIVLSKEADFEFDRYKCEMYKAVR